MTRQAAQDERTHQEDREGPVVLLTGAAGGLGQVIAGVLLADGYRVAMTDADAARLEKLAAATAPERRSGGAAHACDITSESQVAGLIDAVHGVFGRIDVLVCNAGVEPPMAFDAADMAVWDRTLSVNLRAPMLLVKHCLPLWREQGSGCVVCVGSRSWQSGSSTPAYVASKAGLVGLVRSIASELGPFGVNANLVAPSYVATALNAEKGDAAYLDDYARRFAAVTPLGRIIEPADVAYAVSFLASARARNITGEVLHVAAGAQLAPTVR